MYRVKIKERAQKDLKRLPPSLRDRLVNLIRSLAAEPRRVGCQKLSATQEWRIRQGDHRVLYEIDDEAKTVTIVRIKHRSQAYK